MQRPSQTTNETLGYFFGFIGVLIFSFTLPLTRIAVRDLNPTFVALGRALVAAGLSGVLLFATRQPLLPRKYVARIGIVALGVVIGFPLFSTWAMRYVEASHSAIVIALIPLGTAVLGALLQQQRPSLQFWFAACTGSLTVILFILVSSGVGLQLGDAATLGAVVMAVIGYVEGARMSKLIGSWQTICWANLLAAPFLIAPVVLTAPTGPIATVSWLAFAYLGVFSMFLGFVAWYRGLALGGIARVSQIQLVQAFLTITWAWLLLGEHITPLLLIAAGLVVSMIFVARRAKIA